MQSRFESAGIFLRLAAGLAGVGLLMQASSPASGILDVARPRTTQSPQSALWQNVSPKERLAALRAAEIDAARLLLEQVYGIEIDSRVTVRDLVLQSSHIAGEIQRKIIGIHHAEPPVYRDDGTVEVIFAVKVREILEHLTQTLEHSETGEKLRDFKIEKISQEHRDAVISVMGNGAIPGSDGLRKIQAKRAAELDAYRRLGERLMGLQITSRTTVRDLVLESDEIHAQCAALVKGAKPVSIVYGSDLSCEVSLQIKLGDLLETIQQYSNPRSRNSDALQIQHKFSTQTLTETGRGAPKT